MIIAALCRDSRNTTRIMAGTAVLRLGEDNDFVKQDTNFETVSNKSDTHEDCTKAGVKPSDSCNKRPPASNTVCCNISDLHPILNDNKWHLFQKQISFLRGQTAYCLRKDGRLLEMDAEQFRCWNNHFILQERLVSLEEGKNDQVFKDEFVHLHGDVARMDFTKKSSKIQVDETFHRLPANMQNPNSSQKKWMEDVQATAALNFRDKQLQRIYVYPPCYCITCSTHLWSETGFVEVLDHRSVCAQVTKWIQNIHTNMHVLDCSLKSHGKRVERLWKRKTIGQRKTMLAKVSTELPTYHDIANLVGEYHLRSKSRKMRNLGRNSALLTNLTCEELVEDSDSLFTHLMLRSSKHPSQLFLADLLRIQSGIRLLELIDLSYIFGTFNITESKYGSWQKWEDQPVHRFEAVTAPHATIVFESQSLILDLLSSILNQLVSELPNGPSQKSESMDRPVLASPNSLRLPAFPEVGPQPMVHPISPLSLEDAGVIVEAQFTKVVRQLTILRSDNKAFVEHIKTCNAFMEAIRPLPDFCHCRRCGGSEMTMRPPNLAPGNVSTREKQSHKLSNLNKTPMKRNGKSSQRAYHVLAEPHDRVITWLYICRQLRKCLGTRNASCSNSQVYQDTLHELLCMLAHRHLVLRNTVLALCRNAPRPELAVPHSLIGPQDTLNLWLEKYMFTPAWSEARPIRDLLMRACLYEHPEEVRAINGLLQDWIEEAAAIVKIQDILVLGYPSIQFCHTTLITKPEALWFKILPSSNYHAVRMIQERGKKVKDCLHSISQYVLPTGEHNSEWFHRNEEAKDHLFQTWKGYAEATLKYYARIDFSAAWLEVIGRVMIVTTPERVPVSLDHKMSVLPHSVLPDKTIFSESSIPHQSGIESPSFRKVTRKKRKVFNLPSTSEDEGSSTKEVLLPVLQSLVTPKVVHIPIKRSNFPVVKSLFSSAQANVSAVRWLQFLNFMQDAGCKVETGRIGCTFTSQNIMSGEAASVNIHRPHPDSTLYAVHLRNNLASIQDAFGWQKEMFVERA